MAFLFLVRIASKIAILRVHFRELRKLNRDGRTKCGANKLTFQRIWRRFVCQWRRSQPYSTADVNAANRLGIIDPSCMYVVAGAGNVSSRWRQPWEQSSRTADWRRCQTLNLLTLILIRTTSGAGDAGPAYYYTVWEKPRGNLEWRLESDLLLKLELWEAKKEREKQVDCWAVLRRSTDLLARTVTHTVGMVSGMKQRERSIW